MKRCWSRSLASILLALACGAACAQTFPTKPLRLIVPFPPGGAADVYGRVLADHMGRGLGQPILVENKPGGSTIIGTELVARAPADGHTLLVVYPGFVINGAPRPNLHYDALHDFRAVGQAIAVMPSLPIRNLAELIACTKATPGETSYGTPDIGTTHHVISGVFRQATGAPNIHAPFQGEMPALTAASGGHLPMVLVNASAVAPFARNGRVRPLVVTTRERADPLPDVPNMREVDLPESETSNWHGIVAAAATRLPAFHRARGALA